MRNLLLVASCLLTSSTLLADYGKVRMPGEATIKHDGDYVTYNLHFGASCYASEDETIHRVRERVLGLAEWLDAKSVSFNSGGIEYWSNQLYTSRDESLYLNYYRNEDEEAIPNPCYHKYTTRQSVTIRVTKAHEAPAITKALVQDFYNDVDGFLWPLNERATVESESSTYATITSVRKDVTDETIEKMKELAYAHATRVATGRFLAVLGAHYNGQWFFFGADFTDERYTAHREYMIPGGVQAAPIMDVPLPPSMLPAPAPAVISLEPLEYHVDGTFEFGFTRDFNEVK